MAKIFLDSAKKSENKISEASVHFDGLDARTVDRETLVSWLKDGHTLFAKDGRSYFLVEVGEELYIQKSNSGAEEDSI